MKLDENVKGTVSFGNDNEGYAMGKGIIAIRVKNGKMMYVQDTFFVPNFMGSSLSETMP